MDIPKFIKNWTPVDNYINKIIQPYREEITDLRKVASVSGGTKSSNTPQKENYLVDPHLIEEYSFRDNYIRAAYLKVVDKILAGGYDINRVGENESLSETQALEFEEFEKVAGGNIEEHGEQINFLRVLRKLYLSLVKGDDFYLQLEIPLDFEGFPIAEEPPKALHILDWQYMVINKDTNGKLVDLKIDEQGVRIDGAYKYVVNGVTKAIFDKYEIIHANFYSEGTSSYGVSRIRSILFAAATKSSAEHYSSNIFSRQRPKMLFTIDADNVEFEKTKQQIKAGATDPNSDLFVQKALTKEEGGKAIEVDQLSKPQDMAYKDFVDYARSDELVGMGVPPGAVFAPVSKSGWEAMAELHEFDEYINSLRDFGERIFNNQLFKRFEWDAIELSFNKANKRDERNEAVTANLLSPFMTINEIRIKLGLEPLDEGDVIIPSKTSDSKSPAGTGEESTQETSASLNFETNPHPLHNRNVNYKSRNSIIIKSFSVDKRVNKLRGIPPIGEQKRSVFNKIIQFRNEYNKVLTDNLKVFISNTVELIEKSKDSLKKVLSKDNLIDIDELAEEAIDRSVIVVPGMVTRSYEFGASRATIESGILLEKSTKDLDALNALESSNIKLVETGFKDLAKETKKALRAGISLGESSKEIANRIQGAVSGTVEQKFRHRFEMIARTEMNRVFSEGSINNYQKSGVIPKVEGLIGADPDGNCTKTLKGKTFTLDESHGVIPIHPRCTCAWLPIIE